MDHLLNDLAQAEHDWVLASFRWGSLCSEADPVRQKAAFEECEIHRKKCAKIKEDIQIVFDTLVKLKGAVLQDEVKQENNKVGNVKRLTSLINGFLKGSDFSGYPNLNNEGLFDKHE